MKEKWHSLQLREQRMVIAMAIALVCFAFFSFIWQPLNEGIVKAEKKLERQQALLAWVNEKTDLIKQSGNKSGQQSRGSLSSIVNRTAKRNNVEITRIQSQGEDLQVWIDEVVFSQFLQWLNQLVIREGVTVKAVDLADTERSGVVKVRRLQLGKI